MPDELIKIYKQLNNDITALNGDGSWKLPIPAIYVVAQNRRIVFAYVNVDYLQRADPRSKSLRCWGRYEVYEGAVAAFILHLP